MAQGVAGVLDPTGSWVVLVLSPRGIFSSQAASLSSAEDPAGGKRPQTGVEWSSYWQTKAKKALEGVSLGHTAPRNS